MIDALNGKRLAVVGFSDKETVALVAEFDSALAFSRQVSTDTLGNPSALKNYDLIIAPVTLAGPWLSTERRAWELPALVLGNADELHSQAALLSRSNLDFVVSPWRSDDLLLRAAVLLAEGGAAPQAAREPLVLVVDDDSSITALVRSVLISDGITCEVGNNGGQGLELARRIKPDLVVLDVNMPERDGFEVLTELKRDPATSGIRVILLTAAEQESDIMRGFALGAADYVVKPFNPMELLVRIRRFIRRK